MQRSDADALAAAVAVHHRCAVAFCVALPGREYRRLRPAGVRGSVRCGSDDPDRHPLRHRHNFVGRPIDGYLEPRCLLTRQAAQALHRVQTAALRAGYSLKVYDCYRPQRGRRGLRRAGRSAPDDQPMKGEFYPDVPKSRLFADGYIGGARPRTAAAPRST